MKLLFIIHDGLHYNKISNFQFMVAKPWYFSIWMILLYLIVIGVDIIPVLQME